MRSMCWILKIINVSYTQTRLEFVPSCCLQLSADSFLLPRNRGIEFSREMKRGWGGGRLVVWLKTLTAPPRGNIPDGIKELTLQTVNIPTRGSQQETGRGGGGQCWTQSSDWWSFNSLDWVLQGCKREAEGSGWEGNAFYLFVSQRAHLLPTGGEGGGGFWRWVESCHLGLITACSNGTSWTCQGCVHTQGGRLWWQMLDKAACGQGPSIQHHFNRRWAGGHIPDKNGILWMKQRYGFGFGLLWPVYNRTLEKSERPALRDVNRKVEQIMETCCVSLGSFVGL